MKRFTITWMLLLFVLAAGPSVLRAQSIDFEGDAIGTTYPGIGWSATDLEAVVDDDPLAPGNNVLKVIQHNYNAAPVLTVELPEGKTLADYTTFTFNAYFQQGDVGWKDIIVEAYGEMPTAQFANNAAARLGAFNRAMGGSTGWEPITIDITNASTLSGTVYLAFGFNGAGTGDIGGAGSVTTWYADDITLTGSSGGGDGLVTEWGTFYRYGWTTVTNVTAGGATISGDGPPQSNWATLRGAFPEALTATTDQAVVVTGKLEFVGGGPTSWSAFRFGLFNHENPGTLINVGTDSVQWSGGEETAAYGYMVSTKSGSNPDTDGNGGIGSSWAINGGSWISSRSGGTVAMDAIDQAPRRAEFNAGRYDFALSVRDRGDGTYEFRYSLTSEDGTSYWYADEAIDTTQASLTFNGVAFGLNNNQASSITSFTVSDVTVGLGQPIEIPEKPFSSFYVDQWGDLGGNLAGSGWTIKNDASTLVGDAVISGSGPVASGRWAVVVGGFGETVSATMDEALIVRGQFEIVGDDLTNWSPIRFGLFEFRDLGELHYQYTDSARWGYTRYAGTDSAAWVSNENQAYGYLFTPRTGANDAVSGNGGIGAAWAVNNGRWFSSFGGSLAMGHYDQAPRRAIIAEGIYDFEFSVRPLADGNTEVRWYMISEDRESYWHGGTHIDTTQQKTDFNAFAFAIQNSSESTVTGVNLFAVEVDRGAPITIPPKPFSRFFVETWGFLGGKFGGAEGDSTWSLIPGELVGDVTITGDAATGWAAVGGSFDGDVTITDRALIISSLVTFEGGGFEDPGSFRFGLFRQNLGSRDSTQTVGYVWNGDETATGYLILPNTGAAPTWASGEAGSIGRIENGLWYAPEGEGAFGIRGSTATGTPTAGLYELELSIHRIPEGNEIRVKLIKEDGSYEYQASAIDRGSPVDLTFNSIVFAVNNATTTKLAIEALEVNMGQPITVITDVEEADATLPTAFALDQNYPNPFNPTTTIKFSLPETADVRLEVFNLLGQKVMTLVGGTKMPAGHHQVTFNAQDLASGMYIYRIEAANFVSTKRMMLIK